MLEQRTTKIINHFFEDSANAHIGCGSQLVDQRIAELSVDLVDHVNVGEHISDFLLC